MARQYFDGRYLVRRIPREAIHDCAAQGDCTAAVEHWTKRLGFDAPADYTRQYLASTGAWDADELTDHAANVRRLFWLICGDLREDARAPIYLGS